MRVFRFMFAVVAACLSVAAAFSVVPVEGVLSAMGMLTLPPPLDITTLEQQRKSPPGGYEVYEDFLYDTATYLAAGPAAFANLGFFQTARNDVTLSNMGTPGQLDQGQFFHGKALFITPRAEPSVTIVLTAAGRIADWDKIQNTARAILNFALQSGTKIRPNIPLEALGGIGGPVPFIGGTSAPAAGAAAIIQQLRNHAHGGFPLDVILRGGEKFAMNLQVGVQTAISADLPLTLWWYGYRYVPTGRTG